MSATMIQEQPAWKAGVRALSNPELANPGPFYYMTVGAPVTYATSDWVRSFREEEDGRLMLVERAEPGILYVIKKDDMLIDIEEANGKGEGAFSRDVNGSEEKLTAVPTLPADNKRFLIQLAQPALRFFNAFDGLPVPFIRPLLFSRLLRPVTFAPEYLEDKPEIQERIRREGALKLYRELMDKGAAYIKGKEFAEQYGHDLQATYIKALPTVIECYRHAQSEADAYLTTEDARVRQGGAKGAHYDPLGNYYQYLTGRAPVDQALVRALEPKELTVKVEREQQEMLPRVQCESCGEFSNLLESGQPPKFCRGCKEPFAAEEPKRTTGPRIGRNVER